MRDKYDSLDSFARRGARDFLYGVEDVVLRVCV